MGDLNTSFFIVDSSNSHKLIKNMKTLNKMIYKLNLADDSEHLTQYTEEYTFPLYVKVWKNITSF